MGVIAIIIATVLDFPTLITAIGCYRTNKFLKVMIWALIATLCGELVNALVRPTYEPSVISVYRFMGQLLVGLCVYGIVRMIKRKDYVMNAEHDDLPEKEKQSEDKSKIVEGFLSDTTRLLSFNTPWSERTTLEKAYTAAFVIMIIGLLPMPYDFYSSLRVIVCICLYFFFQAIFPQRDIHGRWLVIFIALFVLYNPIIPIHFGEQAIWSCLNILTLGILFKARSVFDAQTED